MTARIKILLIAITLVFTTIANANIVASELKCNMNKTLKLVFDESDDKSEMECKKEKNKSDEYANYFFSFSFFSNIVVIYPYKEQTPPIQLSSTFYKPPITS